jgi:hypothetical protein
MPSSLKQNNVTATRPSAKITWMDTVLSYSYAYTESTQVLAEKMAIRGQGKQVNSKSRSQFQYQADASVNVQKKKLVQHKAHFDNMVPDLDRLQWSKLSLDEMEELASDMIDKLDSLRRLDTADRCFSLSNEYRVLENKLSLLLEAQECVYHIKCIDTLLSNQQLHGKGKDADSDEKFDLRTSIRYFFPFRKCLVVRMVD